MCTLWIGVYYPISTFVDFADGFKCQGMYISTLDGREIEVLVCARASTDGLLGPIIN